MEFFKAWNIFKQFDAQINYMHNDKSTALQQLRYTGTLHNTFKQFCFTTKNCMRYNHKKHTVSQLLSKYALYKYTHALPFQQ